LYISFAEKGAHMISPSIRTWILSFVFNGAAAILLLAGTALAAPGDITTIAGGSIGDDQTATSAVLQFPSGVFVDQSGNVYIAD